MFESKGGDAVNVSLGEKEEYPPKLHLLQPDRQVPGDAGAEKQSHTATGESQAGCCGRGQRG